MAADQRLFEQDVHCESEEDVIKKKRNSISTPTGILNEDGDCYDCNICLDSAHDPVVTLCGHLYCWPCIYKWLRIKSSSPDTTEQQPNCPVCKANVSLNSLVPLYGRSTSPTDSASKKTSLDDAIIPQRPPPALNSSHTNTLHQSLQLRPNFFQPQPQVQPQSFHPHRYFPNPYRGYGTMASSNLGSAAMTQMLRPMIGMFGELMFARMFGTPDTNLFAYSYPNSNHLIGNYNHPRMRRHEMQLEKSLNRVILFLLCCIILCLLLF